MKNLMILILVFIFNAQAMAGELWVTVPEITSPEKLESIAKSQREKLKDFSVSSFFDTLLNHPVSQNILSPLLALETNARRAELNGNFTEALEGYENIRLKLSNLPNVAGVQTIMLAALVHRAYLASLLRKPEAEANWMEARAWGNTDDLPVDEFSPTIIKKFGEAQLKRNLKLSVKTSPNAQVFVNGRLLTADDENEHHAKLSAGTHQVCALAPGALWSCKMLNLTADKPEIVLDLPLKAATEGSCDEPHYSGPEISESVRLLVSFDNGNCERVLFKKLWFTVDGRRLESMEPMSKSVALPEISGPMPDHQSFLEKMTHSPWFWAASVVVVGGAALMIRNQSQTTYVPSQTER